MTDQSLKIGSNYFKIKRGSGIYPVFTMLTRQRVKRKQACNIVVVGEAGSGKSYMAMEIARNLDATFGSRKTKIAKLDPEFGLPQVVFTYQQYMETLMKLPPGHPIIFDEPSYALSKRDWYKDINRALTKTIESQRFLVKPLILPVINLNLLDKTVRSYLIQYMVVMHRPGRATAYTVQASQFQDKVYRTNISLLRYGMMEQHKCDKASCLGCSEMETCDCIRARYEAKKLSIQMPRYEQDLQTAQQIESRDYTLAQLEDLAYDQKLSIVKAETTKPDPDMIVLVLEDAGVVVSRWKARQIVKRLLIHYPDEFF